MHFQGFFFAEHGLQGDKGGLPIENVPLGLLSSSSTHSVYELSDYPVPALVFSSEASVSNPESKSTLVGAVMHCVDELIKMDVPHNVLMSPQSSGFRLYLIPQTSFIRTDPYEIGPAFPELSGFMIVKGRKSTVI